MIVVGLTFGDEGKGTVTDFLVRTTSARAVVRFNGGPQAGHNVVADDGRWHCFAQLGAGALVPGARTILGPKMRVELENLEVEAAALEKKGVADPLAGVVIDPGCVLVTPMHKMICQMEEIARGDRPKGSCGMGVGEAGRRPVTVKELLDSPSALDRLEQESARRARAILEAHPSSEMKEVFAYFEGRCRAEALSARYREILGRVRVLAAVESLSLAGGRVVFEGAQGALLDGERGFVPYVTESRTTYHDAARLAAAAPDLKVGVLRAYGHRHGPGPFVTEDPRLSRRLADPYNGANRWQGPFRVGRLDLLSLRYGLCLNEGVNVLALTGLDRLSGWSTIRICTEYDFEGDVAELESRFVYERTGEKTARISAIRVPTAAKDAKMARLLFACRPAEWISLPGWKEDIRGARALADLPREARALLDLLESERGLMTPIGIVSVGPSAGAKILTPSLAL